MLVDLNTPKVTQIQLTSFVSTPKSAFIKDFYIFVWPQTSFYRSYQQCFITQFTVIDRSDLPLDRRLNLNFKSQNNQCPFLMISFGKCQDIEIFQAENHIGLNTKDMYIRAMSIACTKKLSSFASPLILSLDFFLMFQDSFEIWVQNQLSRSFQYQVSLMIQ